MEGGNGQTTFEEKLVHGRGDQRVSKTRRVGILMFGDLSKQLAGWTKQRLSLQMQLDIKGGWDPRGWEGRLQPEPQNLVKTHVQQGWSEGEQR